MNWASTAILAAAIMGMVNIIDSHLLSRRMPSFRAFLLPVGVIHLVWALLLLSLFPLPEGVGVGPLLVAVASGIVRTAAVSIMLYSLKRGDVSRVIPVVYTSPIFVAIMAVPLLGETIHYLQWLAIIVVVVGAAMVSVEKSPSGATSWLGKSLLLLFAASLLFALADIASKYALAYISFWNMFWLSALFMSGTFLLVSVRPRILRQLCDMKRRNSALALLIFNETLAPVGIVLAFWAMERGPVSLVAAIVGSRPVFVAIYSIILSRILPNFLIRYAGRKVLLLRLVATVMIAIGIAIIYLT